jgi:hypothetical protein
MSITRLQQARQMFRYGGDTMGGPNDRSSNSGSGGYAGSDAGFANTSPSRVGGTGGFTDVTKGTLSDPQEKIDFVGETRFGPTQKYTGGSSFFGGANKYGYTNQYVDPTKSNFGNLKPGYGGRVFGGLMSLLTGIPFVGGAIGNMYDKGQGLFKDTYYDDMSNFNQLGLGGIMPEDFEDEKISLTSFTENDPSNLDSAFKEAYNNYLIDAPMGTPLSFEEFKNALKGIQQ